MERIEAILRDTLAMNKPCECNSQIIHTGSDSGDEEALTHVIEIFHFRKDMMYFCTPVHSQTNLLGEWDNLGLRCAECGKDWSSMNILMDLSNAV